ncbi:MAG: amidohydrolase family protein [Tepidisphaeraceae bacterium]
MRRVLHTQPDDLSRDPTFRRNVGSIHRHRLTFDLCVLAKQLTFGIDLVRACPETSFVLDHCGVPEVKGHALDPWRAHIELLAKTPNVVACKISGLVAYASAGDCGPDALRPFVTHVVEQFGPDRVLFGSDWPVCTLSCSYGTWAQTALELTSGWTLENRQKFFARNAERVYRV